MKIKTTLFITVIVLGMFACSSKKQAINEIKKLETTLYSENAEKYNTEAANEIIKAYVDFADTYPDDKKAPEYLFKAAEVSMGLQYSTNAIKFLETIINKYPDYEKLPTSLFLQGFIYETQLNNKVMAQKFYSQFLAKYPNHQLADDARFSLDNLDKSAEEIIKSFEEKQQPDSTAL